MAIINFDFSKIPEEGLAQAERQAAWRDRAVSNLRRARAERLKTLNKRRDALERARSEYRAIDRGQRPIIAVRRGFVRLPEGRPALPDHDLELELSPKQRLKSRLAKDLLGRPPLTKLVHRKTNALPLFMTALYVAQLEGIPGKLYSNVHWNALRDGTRASWSTLAGLSNPGDLRSRRVRITRALAELEKADLVQLGPSAQRNRFEKFKIKKESGSGEGYRLPGEDAEGTIQLPPTLFLNGWHLVLKPAEIAALLTIIDMTFRTTRARAQSGESGVALPRSARWTWHGLSDEVYEAVHELVEFGLVQMHDPMPNRRRGKFQPASPEALAKAHASEQSFAPVPYRFDIEPLTAALERNAYELVSEVLRTRPVPMRWS